MLKEYRNSESHSTSEVIVVVVVVVTGKEVPPGIEDPTTHFATVLFQHYVSPV